MKARFNISSDIKRKLIDEKGSNCPVCGAKNVPLEIAHIIPISQGGTNDLENLTVLCANCHRTMDRGGFSEMDFNYYLYHLLEEHPDFKSSKLEAKISEEPVIRADIITERIPRNKKTENILIECKNAAFLTESMLEVTIKKLKHFRMKAKFDSYVLAFPGRISPNNQKRIRSSGIQIWDADFIARTFSEEIKKVSHLYFRSLFLSLASINSQPIERQLLDNLKTCQPGKNYWSDYQKLTGRILGHLFCPPLQSPLSESTDKFNVNKRDWIFPNYSDAGFWHFLRQMYKADYIVVDAKNYKNPISKTQVLQIANYLKPHGAGLFAIIATRSGADNSATMTIREQWIAHNKMILILNDTHFENMLLASSSGGQAYKVIGKAIEDFRLSI